MATAADVKTSLGTLTQEERTDVLVDEVKSDPQLQAAVASALLDKPSASVTDILWIVVIGGLIVLLLGSAFYIATFIREGRDIDPLITVFTSALAFIAGLFATSPVARR